MVSCTVEVIGTGTRKLFPNLVNAGWLAGVFQPIRNGEWIIINIYEAKYHQKDYGDRGGFYPPRPISVTPLIYYVDL